MIHGSWATLLTANEQPSVESVHLPDVIQAGQGCNPFFLLPASSGNPRDCRRLAQHLGGAFPVTPLRPSSWAHEVAAGSIEDPAQATATAIHSAQPTGFCLVGGIRESGIIAFEAALRLERQGRVVRLVLFDTPLPGGRLTSMLDTLRAIKRHFARHLRSKSLFFDSPRVGSFEILHFLPEEGDDALPGQSRLGWERRTGADTAIVYLPGDHESLFAEANLPRIGRMLKQWIADGQYPR